MKKFRYITGLFLFAATLLMPDVARPQSSPVGMSAANPFDLGVFSDNFSVIDTRDLTSHIPPSMYGHEGTPVFYRFTTTVPMEITFHNFGSPHGATRITFVEDGHITGWDAMTDVEMTLLEAAYAQLDWNNAGWEPSISGYQAYCPFMTVPPGSYTIAARSYRKGNAPISNGIITTTIRGRVLDPSAPPASEPVWAAPETSLAASGMDIMLGMNLGAFTVGTQISDSRPTAPYWNICGDSGKDIHYLFDVAQDSLDVVFGAQTSGIGALGLTVYEGRSYNYAVARRNIVTGTDSGEVSVRLKKGRYMAVLDVLENGAGVLDISFTGAEPQESEEPELPEEDGFGAGDYPDNAIRLGKILDRRFFTCMRNTSDGRYRDHFSRYGGNEVFYMFELMQPMTVTIHHFGSELPFVDNVLWRSSHDGMQLEEIENVEWRTVPWDDPYDSFTQKCMEATLPAGNYLLCAEGVKGSNAAPLNGELRTTLHILPPEEVPVGGRLVPGLDPLIGAGIGTVTPESFHEADYDISDFRNLCEGEGRDVHFPFETVGTHTIRADAVMADGTPVAYHLFKGKDHTDGMVHAQSADGMPFQTTVASGEYTLVVEPLSADASGTLHVRIAVAQNGAFLSRNRNYTYSISPTVPVSSVRDLSPEEGLRSVQYYDGLGRQIQQVDIAATVSGADLVQPIVFDGMGRTDSVSYLPYVAYGNAGRFAADAPEAQRTYYSDRYSGDPDADYAYTRNVYATDGQLTTSTTPGENGSIDRHPMRFLRRLNTEDDAIRRISVSDDGTLTVEGYYAPNVLAVSESWQQLPDSLEQHSLEYSDAEGRSIAQEVRFPDGERRITYRIYDDMGRERYLIPSMQSRELVDGAVYRPDDLKTYCYYFEYDRFGNIVRKQIPGADPVYSIYDRLGRLVLTQSGRQRADGRNEWSVTKYDAFDRPLLSGFICGGSFESHSTAILAQESCSERRGGDMHGYTNLCYPQFGSESDVLTVSYYDDYDWMPGNSPLAFSSSDALGDAPSDRVVGLPTGSKFKVLGVEEDRWITSATYYDDFCRVVQLAAELYPGGLEVVSNSHDFVGNVIQTRVRQSVGEHEYAYDKWFDYDREGRLLAVRQKIAGDERNDTVTLASYTYDDLGQVTEKSLHGGAETTRYTYRLSGMRERAESPSFSYALSFDRPAAAGLPSRPDGSMAGMIWGAGTQMHSGYNFGYDPMRQMTDAECTLWKPITSIEIGKPESHMTGSGARWDLTPAGSWKRQPGRREGGITYDANGNILSVVRTDADGNPLHELEYRYDGNRLHSIELNGEESALYRYDANGNMTYDGLRDVEIEYNSLNLPERIFAGSDEIRYIYSSDGRKLASVADGSFTYYRSVMVYGRSAETGGEELLYMLQPEGLAVKNSADEWTYKYAKCDHLGNVRVLLAAVPGADGVELIEEQRTDYYPFGLAWEYANLHLNRYLYNGKELQDASVGQLGLLGLYDFGARYYDPMLGRWFNVDPALQLMNPYLFCANAPMIYIDPNGEFFVLLASLVGGLINTAVAAANGGNPLEAFAMGFISGGFGAAFGGAAAGLLTGGSSGFIGGAVTGGVGGFAGSSVSAWMRGASFGDGLLAGLGGAASGAAIGGLSRGIADSRRGFDFWRGSRVSGDGPQLSSLPRREYDRQTLNAMATQAKSDANSLWSMSPGKQGLKDISTVLDKDAVSKGYHYSKGTFFKYIKVDDQVKEKAVGGFTISYSNGHSKAFISPNRVDVRTTGTITNSIYTVDGVVLSAEYIDALGHEMIHVKNFFYGGYLMDNAVYLARSENAAYTFSKQVWDGVPTQIAKYDQILRDHGWTRPYAPFLNNGIYKPVQ